MRIYLLILIFGSIACETAVAQQIEQSSRIDIPSVTSTEGFDSNRYFAEWLNDTEVVSFTRDQKLSRVNATTKEVIWSRDWLDGVSDSAVCPSQMRIGLISQDDRQVVLVNATDGSTVLTKQSDQLGKQSGASSFLPSQIALHPKNGSVLISDFSTHFGNNAYLFSPKLDGIVKKIGVDSMPREISFSANSDRLTILADFDVLNVRDINKNADVYFAGKRFEKPRDSITSVIDAPFFSNAHQDGQNILVYSRDNSWATGQIFVHRLDNKSTIEFDGLNGHIVMDVDFANSRIAVSGTSKNISLFDFDGKKLAELSNATGKRNLRIRFSPNGEKLLICNSDAIWTFEIKPK